MSKALAELEAFLNSKEADHGLNEKARVLVGLFGCAKKWDVDLGEMPACRWMLASRVLMTFLFPSFA